MITTLLATFALGAPQLSAELLDSWAAPAGLKVARARLEQGDIVVYLPARANPGDKISGSIYLEPAGKSSKQLASNEQALRSMAISLDELRLDPSNPQFTTTATASSMSFSVAAADGGAMGANRVELKASEGEDEPGACPVVEMGTAIRVVGRFDGDRGTTMAWIDGVPAGVMAEGRRDCVVSTMNASLGAHRLRIRDNGIESEHMVSVVRVKVAMPYDMRIGRKASVDVLVDGLDGIDGGEYPLRVMLYNDLPHALPFAPEGVEIKPGDVADSSWTGKLEFKPKKKGAFSVLAHLICEPFLRRIGELR